MLIFVDLLESHKESQKFTHTWSNG